MYLPASALFSPPVRRSFRGHNDRFETLCGFHSFDNASRPNLSAPTLALFTSKRQHTHRKSVFDPICSFMEMDQESSSISEFSFGTRHGAAA